MNCLQATVLAFGLATGATSFAQTVPIPGTYVSADHQYNIQITSANPSEGSIQGNYTSNYSPIGAFTLSGLIGGYSWVNNSQGRSGAAPFYIHFGGWQRPNSWQYVIGDTWNGAYRSDNSILASGVRAYVDSTGVTQAVSLGDQVFTLAH